MHPTHQPPAPPPSAPQINILQINLERFAARWQDGRKEGRKVGRPEVEERTVSEVGSEGKLRCLLVLVPLPCRGKHANAHAHVLSTCEYTHETKHPVIWSGENLEYELLKE